MDMDNAPLGFGLSCLAGSCTSIGAAIVFLPCVEHRSRTFFAGAMGVSVGVMLYVSFVEIMPECWALYHEGGHLGGSAESGATYAVGTASFFLGIFLFYVLDFIVHCLDRDHDIEVMDQIVHEVVAEGEREEERANGCNVGSSPGKVDVVVHTVVHDPQKDGTPEAADLGSNPAMTMQACKPAVEVMAVSSTRTLKMGFMTAVAIAIHNFPEGLLAFIGTLEDPSVGGALATAIGIHNIPEGICIAVPIYYAGGSKWAAFGWATLAGMSEPIGALLAWGVFANNNSATANGASFGIVAGIMVAICFKEMIPAALSFDPTNKVTTHAIFVGMGIMALSLVLFHA